MSKIALILGAGAGYVLGARAGRERYDQIRDQATRLWQDPRVQQKKQQAGDLAADKGADLKDKASAKVSEKTSDTDTAGTGTTGTTGTDTTPGSIPVTPGTSRA